MSLEYFVGSWKPDPDIAAYFERERREQEALEAELAALEADTPDSPDDDPVFRSG